MNVVWRLARLLAATVRELADAGENLEAVVIRMVREMEHALAGARQFAAAVLAAGRSIGRELERSRTAAERCRQLAQAALAAGRTDGAALHWVRQEGYDADVRRLEEQYSDAIQVGDRIKNSVRALETALAGARRAQRLILAWHRTGLARRKLHRLVSPELPVGDTIGSRSRRLVRALEELREQVMALAADGEFLGGPTGERPPSGAG